MLWESEDFQFKGNIANPKWIGQRKWRGDISIE